MIRACIISDDSELSSHLGDVLVHQRIVYTLHSQQELYSASNDGDMLKGSPEVVFLLSRSFAEADIETIGALRNSFDGAIVVVANIPCHSVVIKAIRAGASDFVDIGGDLASEVEAISASLRTRQSESERNRLVTVLPSGSHKHAHLVSSNLAAWIASEYGDCVLIDFHTRGGDLCHLFHLTPRHNVLDLLRARHQVDRAMFEQALVSHESGVRLLAGPGLFSDIRDIHAETVQQLVSLARETSPFVIVDVDDSRIAQQAQLLSASRHILLTTALDMVSLHRAKQQVKLLKEDETSSDDIHLLAMSKGCCAEVMIRDAARALTVPSVHRVTCDNMAEVVSINVGRPMVLEMPNSPASRSLTNIFQQMVGNNDHENGKVSWRTPWKAAAAAAASVLPGAR